MTSSYPDIEGQLYTTTTPNATYTEAEARQRAASRREDSATASAAGASALVSAKAYTDGKVIGLATTAAMQAGDQQALSNAKTYTDEQLADFDSFVGVPIFETLAEAEAWEAANPGKTALTLEPSTPDTTAPTWAATLTADPASGGSVVLTASALATDDRSVARYEVTTNGGTSWAAIVPQGKQFTVSGLTGGRTYTGIKLRAVDAAGNTSAPLSAPSVLVPVEGPKDYAYLWDAADATAISWVDRKAGVSLTKDGPGSIAADGTMVAFPKPAEGTTTRTLARYKNAGITLTKSPTFTVVARAWTRSGTFKFQFLMGNGGSAPVLPNGSGSAAAIGNVPGGAPFRADDWQVYTFRYPAEGTTTGAITSGTVTASQTGLASKNWGTEMSTAFHIGSPHSDAAYAFLGDIKEVQVFDRTLTDDEVLALHADLARKHGVTL